MNQNVNLTNFCSSMRCIELKEIMLNALIQLSPASTQWHGRKHENRTVYLSYKFQRKSLQKTKCTTLFHNLNI